MYSTLSKIERQFDSSQEPLPHRTLVVVNNGEIVSLLEPSQLALSRYQVCTEG
jgi:hypothetical protein